MVKSQLAEVLRNGISSTRAISLLGIAIWLPWSFLRFLYRFLMLDTPVASLDFCIAMVTICITSLGGCLLISKTLLRHQNGFRSTVGRTFIAYLTLLVIVGLGQEATDRIIGSGVGFSFVRLLTGLFGLYLIACILDTFDRYRDDVDRLRSEQSKLDRMRRASIEDLARMRSRVVDDLWAAVVVPWRDIDERLIGLRTPRASAAVLRSLAEDIRSALIDPIRSLSYRVPQIDYLKHDQVNENSATVQVGEAVKERRRLIDWREVVASTPTQHPFYPLPVALSISILSLSNMELLDPVKVVVSSSAFFVSFFVLYLMANKLLASWLARQTSMIAWLVWVCVLVVVSIAGASIGFITYSNFWQGQDVPLVVLVGSVLVATYAMVFSLFVALFAKAEATKESVLVVVELTRREATALGQEVDATKQEVAHVLHGEVQSMLTAAAFRLDLAAESLESGTEVGSMATLLDEVQIMLDGASQKINSIAATSPEFTGAYEQSNVRERIRGVAKSWAGIVNIDAQIDSATAVRLDKRINEASLAPVITDIVREAVLNAARHANATQVSIKIDTVGALCRITVVNDGESPPIGTTPGLGLGTLDRFGCEWSLTPGEDYGAVLRIELPFLTA